MSRPMKPSAAITLLNTYRAAVVERLRLEVQFANRDDRASMGEEIDYYREQKRVESARKKENKLYDKITGKLTSY